MADTELPRLSARELAQYKGLTLAQRKQLHDLQNRQFDAGVGKDALFRQLACRRAALAEFAMEEENEDIEDDPFA